MLAHVRSRGSWQGYVLDPAGAKRLRLTMSGSHFTAIDRGMRLLETRARCRVSHAFSEWAQLCVSTKHPNVNPELMVCGLPSSSHALAGEGSNVYATLFCPPLPQAAACDWQTDHLVPVPLRTMLTEPARFGAAQQACRRHPRKRQQRHADICLKVVVRASTPLLHSIPDLEPVHVPGSNSHVCLVLARLKQLDPLPFHTPQLRWTLAIVSGHFRPRLQSSAKSLPKNKRKFKRREKKSRLSSQRTRRTWGS